MIKRLIALLKKKMEIANNCNSINIFIFALICLLLFDFFSADFRPFVIVLTAFLKNYNWQHWY
jgi:hypothetical protein